jgi:hypothetical protein
MPIQIANSKEQAEAERTITPAPMQVFSYFNKYLHILQVFIGMNKYLRFW